jgi:AmmeMemoRadiSam system protein B
MYQSYSTPYVYTPKYMGYLYQSSYEVIPLSLDLIPDQSVRAVLVPHGSYEQCGSILNEVYRRVPWENIKKILFLNTIHQHQDEIQKIVIPFYTVIQFPRHKLYVDTVWREQLLKHSDVVLDIDNKYIYDQSMDVQMPYILTLCHPDTVVLPIIVGKNIRLNQIANLLLQNCTEDTLVIITTDFCHYGPEHNFVDTDKNPLRFIRVNDYNSIKELSYGSIRTFKAVGMCGKYNSLLWLIMARKMGLNSQLLSYKTTGDNQIVNNNFSSISYAGLIFGTFSPTSSIDTIFNYRKLLTKIRYCIKCNKKIDIAKISKGNVAMMVRATLILIDCIIPVYQFKIISELQIFNDIKNLCILDKLTKSRWAIITLYDNNKIIGRSVIDDKLNSAYNFTEQLIISTINIAMFNPKYIESSLRTQSNYSYLHSSEKYRFNVSTIRAEKDMLPNKLWSYYEQGIHGIRYVLNDIETYILPSEIQINDMDNLVVSSDKEYCKKVFFENNLFHILFKENEIDEEWPKGKYSLFKSDNVVG